MHQSNHEPQRLALFSLILIALGVAMLGLAWFMQTQ